VFRVKICGVTAIEDAGSIAKSGADAIGLNFWQGSPRFVEMARACELAAALPPTVVKVGVFVDADEATVRDAVDAVGIDWMQWHGDEPPERVARREGPPLIKAFRLGKAGLDPVRNYLDCCRTLGRLPDAVLIDAHVAGHLGGTGRIADWQTLGCERASLGGIPLILAGGLTESNVGEAIRTVRPDAVDTASGVECGPGRKDHQRVARFVDAALDAFASIANDVFAKRSTWIET
jgi:phosphoribosylanthranilate isomerase